MKPMIPASMPPAKGHAKLRFSASKEVLRQASSGPDAGEQQQEERDGDVHFVEKWRADADFAAFDPFGEDREERAPQNREARGEKNQIVEQEAGFAGDERVELIIAAQVIAIFPVSGEADHESDDQESDEPAADG